MDDFLSEAHAEGKVNYIIACLDVLSINPNIQSREDWKAWCSRIENIFKTTKNADLQKRSQLCCEMIILCCF